MTDTPEGLYYTKEHEWMRVENDIGIVGITNHAQCQMGDITEVVELPAQGSIYAAGEEIAGIESSKSYGPIHAPASGTVDSLHDDLEDSPELVNDDPYGEGWILTIKLTDTGEIDTLMESGKLMDASAYKKLIEDEDE